MASSEKKTLPPQSQDRQPGIESEMTPRPKAEDHTHRGCGKLDGKVALAFAKEGADVAIA